MRRTSVVLRVVARLLLGPSIMVAAALIVKGYTDVGDGFAAGMVVALAIALCYVAFGATDAERLLPPLRYSPHCAVGGLLLSLAVGFFPVLYNAPLFSHEPGPGERVTTFGSLELFTPLIFDLGIFLLVVGVMTVLLHQMAEPDAHATDTADDGRDKES
ncbi:MnhB domain-containing protein [Mycobacterium sp. GA-1199]|uniref:MnhB domain-containing protein n=1 Tax=Mycobacterium sp. GA-1199 TaxID=1772287 RepID=UPI0018D23CAF|nr:MnhB domain-containing protein [Mycobacterium sp. GA-1199]